MQVCDLFLSDPTPPLRLWGIARPHLDTLASIVAKWGGGSFVWSFVVLFLSCVCVCDLFLFDSTPPLRLWGIARPHLDTPPSIIVEWGVWSFAWSFVVLFLSCGCVCDPFLFDSTPPHSPFRYSTSSFRHATFDRCWVRGVVFRVWSFVVLFLSCVCVCDLFLFDSTPPHSPLRYSTSSYRHASFDRC